jgi:hypothetical protein
VLATIFTTVALDVTGIAAATVLFTASFLILPYKRKRAKEQFRLKTETLRTEMRRAFESKSAEEIERAVDNVRGALDPYVRFVRSEHIKVKERASTLDAIRERLRLLKHEIESLVLIR